MRPSQFWDWSDDDRAYAIALAEHEASLDAWGIPVDEATSPDWDRDNRSGKGFFEVEAPLSHVELAVDSARKALGKDDETWGMRVVRVHRVER